MWHEVPAVDVGSRSVSISTENNAGLELVNIAVLIKLALEHFFDRNHGVIETGKSLLKAPRSLTSPLSSLTRDFIHGRRVATGCFNTLYSPDGSGKKGVGSDPGSPEVMESMDSAKSTANSACSFMVDGKTRDAT